MRFIRLVIFEFIHMPLRGHALSIFEGLVGLEALRLYAGGHEGWGITAMLFVILFAYIDGASGWSMRKGLKDD